MKRVTMIAGLAAAVALFGGCKKDEPTGVEITTGGEQTPIDPMAILPTNAFFVLRVDVDRLQRSPYADALTDSLEGAQPAGAEPAMSSAMSKALDDTQLIVAAGEPPPSPEANPPFVAVLRGRYEPGQLERVVREALDERGELPQVTELVGHEVYIHGEIAAAELDGQTWVVAPEARMRELLERAELRAGGPGPWTDPELKALGERVGFNDAMAAGEVRALPEMTRRAEAPIQPGPFDPKALDAIAYGGFRFDAADGIAAQVLVETTEPWAAESLVGTARTELRAAGQNPFVGMLGLAPALANAQLTHEGTLAGVSLQLTDGQTRQVITSVGAMLAMIAAGAAEGATIAPDAEADPPPPAPSPTGP